ncbi:MAG: carboxypeptidase-like regulatory domain-containing protein [Bacteroidales bacterium]|nr:carboxypeptidase-like regulatory domain-containing protein [Bacteroidales bacterium]
MKSNYPVVSLIFLMILLNGFSQTTHDETISESVSVNDTIHHIKGLVLDFDKQTPLPYATIYALNNHQGTVSNEKGYFSLNLAGLEPPDTLRFQYIGYKTRNLPVDQSDTLMIVYLTENIFNLSEILIFGGNPDPKAIVKKVLENKDSNYKSTTSKKQVFIRERNFQNIEDFNIKYKKSSIPELDRETLEMVEKKFPRNFTSFSDFLGNLYFNKNLDDSVNFKIDPVRIVALKEKNMADLEQLESVFESVFANTAQDEYWKARSGIFGDKIDLEEDSVNMEKDSLNEDKMQMKYYGRNLQYRIRYSLMDDKDQWEFLYKTGAYKYTLAGGTNVNGEDVYIIDFTPKSSGHFTGRMFITTQTYALIRADYEYAPGKTGRDIHLLGFGYTETQFGGSIYFEKNNDIYTLKYFSYRRGTNASVDRNFSLIKKRKKFFIDKKLKELKVGFYISMAVDESFEYLVLDSQSISLDQFNACEQKKTMDIIYVDQFDDKLWKGYSIIEPTQQMKEYKKQEIHYGH